MTPAIVGLVVRLGLVLLFLPFSALDKILGFNHAVGQARQMFSGRAIGVALILIGLLGEIFCSLGVVSGIADRASAFFIAGYCAVTAVLFKQFWAQGDFWSNAEGKGRSLFWDFLKNLSLGAGFLLIVAERLRHGEAANEIAATRFVCLSGREARVRYPDGHLLQFTRTDRSPANISSQL